MPLHFLQKVARVWSMHPPECAAILASFLLWPPADLPSTLLSSPSSTHLFFYSCSSPCLWARYHKYGCNFIQTHFLNTNEQQTDSQKLHEHAVFRPGNSGGGMKPYTLTWPPDLQETVTNISCIYMYVWAVTRSDSPTHNLGGVVACWQLLTHSHTQNAPACSCRSARAHLSEQTRERFSCTGSEEDRTTRLPH